MASLYGEPYGVNYAPSTPSRERLRSDFADDIVGAIHVRLDEPSIRRPVEPSLHPPAAEDGWQLGCAVDWQQVRVEKAGFAGVALLGNVPLDAHYFRFVGQHVDEAGMGYADEVLIPPPPYIHFLLPQRVLADDERAEVDALEDKRLPNFVVGRVVEVLAGGGGTVYRG
jgi:hypothetical protein